MLRTRHLGRARLALLLALCLLAACGGGEVKLSPPISISTSKAGTVRRIVRARLTMHASGAETLDVKLPARLDITEIIGGRSPQVTWFLSVSAGIPVKLADGRLLVFDADLAPGVYRGPGAYRISRAAQNQPGGVANPFGGGAAYVMFITPGGEVPAARFDRLGADCTLLVATRQRTGTVTCPKLAEPKGKAVSVRWSWELT